MSDDLLTIIMPRHTRRLSDTILIAFHLACDQGALEVARRLLEAVDSNHSLVLRERSPLQQEAAGPGGLDRSERAALAASKSRRGR